MIQIFVGKFDMILPLLDHGNSFIKTIGTAE